MNTTFGLNADTWQALSAIGSILAAAATFWAVVVSLRISRRAIIPRISVSSSLMQLMMGGEGKGKVAIFRVTNTGECEAEITAVVSKMGKHRFVTVPGQGGPFSDQLPKRIKHGEGVRMIYPLEEWLENAEAILRTMGEHRFPRLALRKLQFGFSTSVGIEVYKRADEDLRKALWEKFKRMPKQEGKKSESTQK